ncbi:EF-P lysine aminoacylase EpmA [Desulfopila aestuarii]|uniref:Lysyl-tRNA synthetase, class 2 n=1 Tax=Desulfopila aestuarii DSM 18488 TaxID=1121416 RepID=A0A1M7Y2M2_9BACT|nr:EF-P lysine aminoacylase EpmA [Desulfopila aestuarii]SHO46143.1 lysyl-tRNA synthetase, class 2 [Desulfopila aestuarii DSM 18488]
MLDLQGLHIRAALFRFIRDFFSQRDFLEVDTPIRQPVIIPECNIVPIMADGQYLQTSPELCMKRLLAAGCQKIFQICPCFRKDELGKNHLEEFIMLEWYRIDANYRHLMLDCEELLQYVVWRFADQFPEVCDQNDAVAEALRLLSAPADRMTVAEAFDRFAPVSVAEALQQEIFEEMLVEFVEPELGKKGPFFLVDYPHELASLAKVDLNRPEVAERFELYLSGVELANGFTELTDAGEQRRRFVTEIEVIRRTQGREQVMPERFLGDLGLLNGAAGIAFGIDRLLMLLLAKETIHNVVSFNPADF